MLSSAVLNASLVALAAFVFAAVAALFGHGVWLRLDEAWNEGRLAPGREALYSLMRDEESSPTGARQAAVTLLRRLSDRLQERLVLSLARSLDPSTSAPIHRVAREVGIIERAEHLCRSRFWWRRLRGARLLSLLGGGRQEMVRLLRDPHPAVKTQAVDWAAEDPSPDMVRGLIDILRDPAESELFTVQDALLRAGSAAVGPIIEMLQGGEGPGVESVLRVAAALADPAFVAPAVRLCAASDPAMRAGAAELLGATGGGEGIDILTSLLDDRDPRVRAAAARALGKVRHWRSAPQLASRMRDTSWEVRRSAGLALRAVGPPGMLMLRKMLSDYNNFAADMAQQVLDMPAGVGDLRA